MQSRLPLNTTFAGMGSGFSHLGAFVCSEEEAAEIVALGAELNAVELSYSGEPGVHIVTLRYSTTKDMAERAIPGWWLGWVGLGWDEVWVWVMVVVVVVVE